MHHVSQMVQAEKAANQRIVKQLPRGSVLVELGSFMGRSSVAIAAVMSAESILYCVDHFRGSAEHQRMRLALKDLQAEFLQQIETFGVKDRIRVLAHSSSDAVGKFEPESIDFLFIDASQEYGSVRNDLLQWYCQLKRGGWLLCDDYHPAWPGVIQAIRSTGLSGEVIGPGMWLHQKPLGN